MTMSEHGLTRTDKKFAGCQKFIRTQAEAVLEVDEYSRRIPPPFQFGEMNAYFCNHAQAWHIGHRGKRRSELAAYDRMGWWWVSSSQRVRPELDDEMDFDRNIR